MKKVLATLLCIAMLLSLTACGKSQTTKNHKGGADQPTEETTQLPAQEQPVFTVGQQTWEQTFSEDSLGSLLESYTVTNQMDEGQWDTCMTAERVSRLAKTKTGELVAGGILTNGDNGVIQYTFGQETGWEQGVYDETDTVIEYVEAHTQKLIETLKPLQGAFENTVWDETQSAYVATIEFPYDGPTLADPSQELPTEIMFEVFFVDGKLSKIHVIQGESKSLIHSFGTTPIPQLPELQD